MITPYESFTTSDGHMIIAAGNQRLWENLCQAIGCLELVDDPRFTTMAGRNTNNAALMELLETITRQKTTAYWVELLEKAGIPCGRIRSLKESLEDEHVVARQMVKEISHPTAGKIKLLGNPVKLSETPGDINMPPPLLGEHTVEILQDLGMSPETIARLKEERIV